MTEGPGRSGTCLRVVHALAGVAGQAGVVHPVHLPAWRGVAVGVKRLGHERGWEVCVAVVVVGGRVGGWAGGGGRRGIVQPTRLAHVAMSPCRAATPAWSSHAARSKAVCRPQWRPQSVCRRPLHHSCAGRAAGTLAAAMQAWRKATTEQAGSTAARLAHHGVRCQPLCDALRVGRLPLHAERHRLQPADEQPAVKGAQGCALRVLPSAQGRRRVAGRVDW